MKNGILFVWLWITLLIGSFVCVGLYCDHVRDYQKATRAYVYGAYKNGAITESEYSCLLDQASCFHAYPEVRMRRAKHVRAMVDRAYQEQR